MSSDPESDNPLPQEDTEKPSVLIIHKTEAGETVKTWQDGERCTDGILKRPFPMGEDKSGQAPCHNGMKKSERLLRSVQNINITLGGEIDSIRRRLARLETESFRNGYTEAGTQRVEHQVMADFYDAIRRAETSLNGVASVIFRDINATGEIATKETVPESSAPPADE
jgi:hypothetical protein